MLLFNGPEEKLPALLGHQRVLICFADFMVQGSPVTNQATQDCSLLSRFQMRSLICTAIKQAFYDLSS